MPTTSFQNNVDIKDHDGSTTGLTLGGTLVTATASELNIMDGVTATASELNAVADTSVNGATEKLVKVTLATGTMLDGCEQSAGYTFPTNCLLADAFVVVNTGHGSTATLDVGTSSGSDDPDGILDAIDIETAGVIPAGNGLHVGCCTTYFESDEATYGDLLADIIDGADGGATGGVARKLADVGGDALSVTASSDISGGAADVDLYLRIIEIA